MPEECLKDVPPDKPVEIWFQDEARVGRKNGQVHQWAAKGTRPRQAADQRHENAHIFGAVCPAFDKGAALVMPHANTEAMQKHLEEISAAIAAKAHGVVIMDRAGRHKSGVLNIPENLSIRFRGKPSTARFSFPSNLPPCSPELNPVENIRQFLRQTYLSNRVFENRAAIVDACCDAWNRLTAETGRIKSIATRNWVATGQ